MLKRAQASDIDEIKGADGKTYRAKELHGQLYLEEVESEQQQPQPQPQPIMVDTPGGGTDSDEDGERQPGESGKPSEHKVGVLNDNAFRAKLRSVMTDNKYDRVLRGRTRGQLDMGRLPKVQTGSTSVFKRKEARKNKHYNVTFLVDCSGSMIEGIDPNRGVDWDEIRENDEEWRKTRMHNAAEMCVYLHNNFANLNINTSVIGFNRHLWHMKGFDEPYNPRTDDDKLYTRIVSPLYEWSSGTGDNNDYEAIHYAYSQFPKNGGRNILIMLSDGNPNGGGYELDVKDAKTNEALTQVDTRTWGPESTSVRESKEGLHMLVKRHERDVTSFGIGIGEGGWQIPRHQVVNNKNELRAAMVGMLGKEIKRG